MEQNIYQKRKYISFPKITICYIFIFLASIFWCISYSLIAIINPIKINPVDNSQDDIMNRISFELHSIAISQIFFIILYYVNLYLSNSESKLKYTFLENEEIISTDNTKIPDLLIRNKKCHFPLINFKTTLLIFHIEFFSYYIYIYFNSNENKRLWNY